MKSEEKSFNRNSSMFHDPSGRARLELSDLEQATSDCNRYRVRPIVGSQFVHQVLNVKVDGSFRDGQLISDLLVTGAVPYESEHLQLPLGELLVAQVFGEADRHLCRYVS